MGYLSLPWTSYGKIKLLVEVYLFIYLFSILKIYNIIRNETYFLKIQFQALVSNNGTAGCSTCSTGNDGV
jgi:hypothetical protein